eukprot:CAMPEP_0116557700 /NCGR_PEP_ID=MMETSP0397-20121206/9387_1 /TAXON_ID=216820 /ORGANISM="Cyclophora tenuis, Strain ECT3854" /LENGTH=596 /DNA_ID=CAMNT_0004083189 /DNA_START=71 /DNA_END=1861 /DNA_ORIENTATION=+
MNTAAPQQTAEQPGFVTPPFGPAPSPAHHPSSIATSGRHQISGARFAPLQPSPPQPLNDPFAPLTGPAVPALGRPSSPGQIQLAAYQNNVFQPHTNSNQASQNSSDDSGFVMVEHGTVNRSGSLSPGTTPAHSSHRISILPDSNQRRTSNRSLTASPPSSPRYVRPSAQGLGPRSDYMVVNDSTPRQVPRGMLSTSPGTGLAFMGMLGRTRLINQPSASSMTPTQVENQFASTTKMIAAAEDVGRRAISVAHLGDTRAYLAMRLIVGGSGGSSLFSATPMEGVEEEKDDDNEGNVAGGEDNSSSTEPAGHNRRRAVSADRSMTDIRTEDEDEMPFAFPSDDVPKENTTMPIPSRSESVHKRSSLTVSKPISKPNPVAIRVHFGEALSCYLKSLSMLKNVLGAAQKVKKECDGMTVLTADQRNRLQGLSRRCDVTTNWLAGQFTGVLERADAATGEIGKLSQTTRSEAVPITSVEELIYNHSLACGRDGAVKQLLGQYDAARSCYRSAGLLAETLLMEPNVGKDDRKVLEGYVDGFAARIVELDQLMMQQSRSVASSPGNSIGVQKRGSGVIGLIGGIPSHHNTFPSMTPPFSIGGQ